MAGKGTICLWYDGTAAEAAEFYAATFPDSTVGRTIYAPGDYPDGHQGDPLVVEFTVCGIPCVGPNGGPRFTHSEAFSIQVHTDDQAETDRPWDAVVGNGGQESACGCRHPSGSRVLPSSLAGRWRRAVMRQLAGHGATQSLQRAHRRWAWLRPRAQGAAHH